MARKWQLDTIKKQLLQYPCDIFQWMWQDVGDNAGLTYTQPVCYCSMAETHAVVGCD